VIALLDEQLVSGLDNGGPRILTAAGGLVGHCGSFQYERTFVHIVAQKAYSVKIRKSLISAVYESPHEGGDRFAALAMTILPSDEKRFGITRTIN
jgi:hypothetical protein